LHKESQIKGEQVGQKQAYSELIQKQEWNQRGDEEKKPAKMGTT
jgi:hypothetical protein